MPINGQMTLDDVVRAGQEGVEWGQRQEQVQRERRQQQMLDEADRAAAGVIDASKAEWAANGAQGRYQPNDTTMLKAAEARGMAFARGGDWQNFMKNEASVQGHRVRVRAGALRQFEQDGDVDRLARTVYPTMFDGKEIVGSELVKGGASDSQKGAPSGPHKYRFKLSDGSSALVDPAKLVSDVKVSLVDPMKSAEQEIQLNFLRAQEAVKTKGKIDVERAKGDEERKTEGTKQTNRLTLADVETQGRLQVAGANNDAAQRRAETTAGATVKAAQIRADGARDAAKTGAKAEKDGLTVSQKWQDMAKNHYGKVAGGLMGGTRVAGQATLDLAATAQRIHEANKGVLTESQALDQAAKFLKLTSPDVGLDAALDPTK